MKRWIKEIRKHKRDLCKFIFCILGSICIAMIVSLGSAAFYYVKGGENKGKLAIDATKIQGKGAIEAKEDGFIIPERGGIIEIDFSEEVFINKLQYQYAVSEIPELSKRNCVIKLYTENIYGDKSVKKIKDDYFLNMSRSVVNIKDKVSRIAIMFPKSESVMEISNFVIDNRFKWNPYLTEVVAAVLFLVLFLALFYKKNAKYPEISAFVCIIVLSSSMLLMQPAYCSGWDEEIHFPYAYDMAVTLDGEGTPQILDYLVTNYAWLDYHHEASIEEHKDMIQLMNRLGEERKQPSPDKCEIVMSSIGYIFQSLFISIGRFLGLPFYLVWILGKFANVLLYALGMSIAISIVPIGKRLLTVISLFPVMVFQSTSYTYDVTVIVFLTIGISIWIKEIMNKESVFSYKWRIIFVACMVLGCMPKAVYAPLLLGSLFMPSTKFYSSKDHYIFKGGIILCFLLLMSTFVLPTLLSPPQVADVRGGDTSVVKQLEYVLKKPFAYGIILLQNIGCSFEKYVTGEMFCNMAYIGRGILSIFYSVWVVGIALTDVYEGDFHNSKVLNIKNKVVSLLIILATIVLIWTALYLSFTEIGKTKIAGVQGRYYLPFIFLLYLLCRSEKIENRFNVEKYQMFVTGISCFMLIVQIILFFLVKSCI